MHNFNSGKFVLMATLLVAIPLLLPSCSWSSSEHWTGSDHVSWKFTIPDADGGERFDWKSSKSQIELTSKPAAAGVVVRKLDPADLWGLREGDTVITVANKPTRTVRRTLEDLHGLNGADAVASVKRAGAQMKVELRSVDYLVVLPLPIGRHVSMVGGENGSSGSSSLSAGVK